MKRKHVPVLVAILACASLLASPAAYKIEQVGACANPEVSDPMKALLQEEGVRVSGDKGPLCDIWLRKTVPLKPGSSTAEYGSLNTGLFMGIVVYSSGAGDYRGQSVKPGVYTIRYQTMPADGNHMGVSPTQEYVLLCPAAADRDPGKDVEYEALLELSRKVSGTNHPTPLYLVPPTGGGSSTIRDAGNGHWAVEIKAKAKPGGGAEIDFPAALILVGRGEG